MREPFNFLSSKIFAGYKHADGKKIDGRRVLVDVERARTVKGWLPRRLGGGLGGTRRGGPDVNIKHSGREDDRKRHDDSVVRGGSRERDRERSERDSRPERRRSRSRDRDRERDRDRKRRSRSRDRKRRRSRSRDRGEEEERRRHRSRSPRDRKKRSKSRERKHRRDRDRERNRGGDDNDEPVKIKQEPEDDYPEYPGTYYNNFPLKDEEGNPRNGPKYEDGVQQQQQQQQQPPLPPNNGGPMDY